MPLIAAVLDAVLVIVFVLLGRETHEHGLSVTGVLGTAWPFLVALALAWVATRAWRSPWRLWPSGIVIWLVTVVGGLALRGLAGGGLAFSFQLVTLAVLAIFLLVPRAVAQLVLRGRRTTVGMK